MAASVLRRTLLDSIALFPLISLSAASAADFNWNGVWAGTNPKNKRETVVTIAKGKVVSWHSNGTAQPIDAAEVKPDHVGIRHKEGATVWITPNKDGSVSYTWSGNGQQARHKLTRRS